MVNLIYKQIDDLYNYFNKYGQVVKADVLFDNNRGASRCFGFVLFEHKESVDKIVRDNNFVLKGKKIDVKQALPKALQKSQNVTCQSGVDILLSKNKTMGKKDEYLNEKSSKEDYEFVDMVTSKSFI
jgi:RNA recognition motif-containing protein